MSPHGGIEWKAVEAAHRNEVPWETIYEFRTPEERPLVVTGGHRIYVEFQRALEAEGLSKGAQVMRLSPYTGTEACATGVVSKRLLPSRRFMYDLTVADNHNLVLHRSGVVVHNCPDKFYHFRPPEHEGDIGQYNRIFGQIWEDAELLEYLQRSLDWFNMHPPNTAHNVTNLSVLVQQRPDWRTAILWGAIVHACFALSLNWVADEFDYSIGGVSLSIEKSSKYESMKSNAEGQLDKAMEAKARTVKYIRGLQQHRYGIGVRSSFGPNLGRGILSPRNFFVWPFVAGLSTLLAEVSSHASSLSILLTGISG